MDDQQFILLMVALVALIFVLWSVIGGSRSKPSKISRKARKAAEKAAKAKLVEEEAPASEPLPANEDDVYTDAASRVRRQLEEAALEAQAVHERKAVEVDEKLDRARHYVQESGVGEGAAILLEIMWNWPDMTQRGEWARPAGMHELEFDEAANQDETSDSLKLLTWRWMGRTYVLRLDPVNRSIVQAEEAGLLSLQVDGQDVMGLDVEPDGNGLPNVWTVVDVDALKSGDWMPDFVEFAGRLKIADDEKRRQMGFERNMTKAERIEFDDPVPE